MEAAPAGRKRKDHDGSDGDEEASEAVSGPGVLHAEGDVEVEEEAVAEVMKWLEEEINAAALPHSPSSPSYRQETSFVTINGNEESCGPSFSCSASTVMASVDTSGGVCGVPYFVGCPSDWPSAAGPSVRGTLAERSEVPPTAVPADGEEEDEMAWLAGVLGVGGGALEVEGGPV